MSIMEPHADQASPSPVRECYYRRAGLSFACELADEIERGESIVLLGPRYVGKRRIVLDVRKELERPNSHRILDVHLLSREWDSRATLRSVLSEELAKAIGPLGWETSPNPDDLLGDLRRFLETTPCSLVALVSDVDALPDHLARRMLKAARELSSLAADCQGQFTILLTGSVGLAPLVQGAGSDLNAKHYVIQSFDEELFGVFLSELISATAWRFGDELQCGQELFRTTGGNVYALRVLFWGLLEGRRVRHVPWNEPLSVDEIRDAANHLYSPTSTPVDYWIHSFSRIEVSPPACEMLTGLLTRGELPVGELAVEPADAPFRNPPTEIELSGVAVREDGRLRFSSPLVESIARKYFTDWALGDLFACGQQWEHAFSHYHRAAREMGPWVYSASRRPQLSSAATALEVALHAEAARGPDGLCELFTKGARFLLGFEEVGFWSHRGGRWQPSEPATSEAEKEDVRAKHRSILPDTRFLYEGVHPLEEGVETHAILVGLPSEDPDNVLAVALSNFGQEAPLTRDRRRLCMGVIDAFCVAFVEACRISRTRKESSVQQHLLKTIPAVIEAIQGRPAMTMVALETAADRLRDIGYRRVMVSMVTPDRSAIHGVFDSRPEGEPDIAARTRYPLVGGGADNPQQLCVKTGEKVLIEDALSHSLADHQIVRAADIRAMMVFPVKHQGEVLGTIHMEREDKKLPPMMEIQSLEEYFIEPFGKVIALIERMNMLETAVCAARDPLVVVDKRERLRYVNQSLALALGMGPGWQGDGPLVSAKEKLLRESLQTVQAALREGRALLRYIHGRKAGESHRRGEWEYLTFSAEPIRDWRGILIGAVLQAHDMTHTGTLFDILKGLAESPDVERLLDGVMGATRAFGFEQGRLYLIDPETNELVGRKQYGCQQDSPGAKAFEEGTVKLLGRDEPGSEAWRSFTIGKPILFHWDKGGPDLAPFTTRSGLPATKVQDPKCPEVLGKRPGAYWIDFPLFRRSSGEPIGKLSLDCTEDLAPELYEVLCILAEVASALLGAVSEHEERARNKLALERKAMEKALAAVAHDLLARASALGVLHASLEDAWQDPERQTVLWQKFSGALSGLDDVLSHVGDRLRPLEARRERHDVVALLRSVLQRQLPEGASSISTHEASLAADIDADLMEQVFQELVENARKAMPDGQDLHMSVTVESARRGTADGCSLRFVDNGPGIPENLRERVFDDLFSQRPGKNRGRGLGLGFVRRVLEAHGGTARAENPPTGSGACIVLTFDRFAQRKEDETP